MLFAIAVIVLLIIDQALKYWVTLSIPLDEGVRALLPGVVEMRNIHNTGAAFSLFSDAPRWVFIVLAVVFVVIVVTAIRRRWIHGAFGRWMSILLLAGALGNLLDRMLSGYVVDMFAFQFWPTFPVFNFADVCLVLGGIGFFFYALLHKEPESAAKEKQPAAKPRKAKPEREPDVKEARRAEKKPAPAVPADREEPTQRMKAAEAAAKAEAEAKSAEPAPAPAEPEPAPEAPKPEPGPEAPKPAEPASEDPFAAWDQAVQSLEAEAKAKAEAAAEPEPIPEPKPSEVKPTVPRRPKPAEDSFSLEDILAEFKDE